MGCGNSQANTANGVTAPPSDQKYQQSSATASGSQQAASNGTNPGQPHTLQANGQPGQPKRRSLRKGNDDDEEELEIDHEEEERQVVRTKAMDKLAQVVLNRDDNYNIEDDLFVYDDCKVNINEIVKARAERMNRVRRPQSMQKKKDSSANKKEGTAAGQTLGDEDIFRFGDFNVSTTEEDELPMPGIPPPIALSFNPIHSFSVYTLLGHASRVKCIAMTPNEKQFVSCSNEDTSVTMQDSNTGREVTAFMGHEDTIISAAFSTDFKFLATTSRDNTMILWDVVTAKQVLTFEHEKVVICCAFSRDSKYLVSGCQDKVCRIWDTRKGREVLSFNQHEGIIIAVAYSPVEDLVCSASADKTLRIWTSSKGECQNVLQGHTGIVLTCWFNSTGQNIVSNDEKAVKVWKTETGECLFTANVDNYMKKQFAVGVKKLTWTLCAYCPGKFGHYIVVASNTRVVMVLDPDNGDEILWVQCKAPVYCLSAGVDSRMAFGDSFGNVYVMKLH